MSTTVRKPTRLRVAVFMGGWSHEREVSLRSGTAVFGHLSATRYERRAVQFMADRRVKLLATKALPNDAAWNAVRPMTMLDALRELVAWQVDVVVLALHGAGGEDGAMQGLLDTLGIPYTHSGVTGAAVSMDKELSKQIYAAHGIPTPPHVIVRPGDDGVALAKRAKLGWPVVAKPPCLGSSFEVYIARDANALRAACKKLLKLDARVLVEKYIRGREFTCAALQREHGGRTEALPVTEIVPMNSEFFDLDAKYTPGATQEITPAPINKALTRAIQSASVRCHEALRCESVSRTDFIVDTQGSLFALETNAIPGMTETSLLPQAAEKAGMSFGELLAIMIGHALARAARTAGKPSS